MRFLLIGATGKLGSSFYKRLLRHKEVGVLDVCSLRNGLDKTYKRIIDSSPDVVINCSAFNGMENCEREPWTAFAINGAAPAIIADACLKAGSKFVHFSTDYVFEGRTRALEAEPIYEFATPEPRSVYARSKYQGEFASLPKVSGNPWSMVFRVSSLYNNTFTGPLDPIKQFLDNHEWVRTFSQAFTPTHVETVTKAVIHALKKPVPGIYNLVTSDVVSRNDFARYIIRRFKGDQNFTVEVKEIDLPMKRPLNVCLLNSCFERTFGYKLPTWQEDVDTHIEEGLLNAHRNSQVV